MTPVPSDKAREDLNALIQQVSQSHEPVHILGTVGTAVLVGEEDWRSIQETLHLLSVPGMRESIRDGIAEPLDSCAEEPGW
jgi:antitoxin YefM